ncbi:MAG: 16S rRNA (cytidine(1402)-2'-O)-methyltransferase [Betaproteobacteria bacterium]
MSGIDVIAVGGSARESSIGARITSTRVAGRDEAQDNAAAANNSASKTPVTRCAKHGVIEARRSGARMTENGEMRMDTGGLAERASRAEPGSLYVVATPIGNLRDVTLRALDILRSADVICAEDTRVTAKLLARYGVTTRPRALHAHNEAREVERVRHDLTAGRSVAIVSDAGTPAISDPGARVVRAVARAGHRVVPVAGASAVAVALSAAGLEAERFAFLGFLPSRSKARRALLEAFAPLPTALVIYEAPHRVAATVDELSQVLDPRRALTIARELTKQFETIATMPLGEGSAWLAADANRVRGEFVLIVDERSGEPRAGVAADAGRILAALLEELPPARAVRLAAKLTGVPREQLYEQALKRKPEPLDRA